MVLSKTLLDPKNGVVTIAIVKRVDCIYISYFSEGGNFNEFSTQLFIDVRGTSVAEWLSVSL